MIVGHMNPARIKWDLFIILLAVYNSICLPLEIAFRPAFIITNPFVKIMDLIIDFLFLIDILISFRTTYIHPISGDEIIESKLIAKNYIAGRFWIDFFSTIPFEKFTFGWGPMFRLVKGPATSQVSRLLGRRD